MGPKPPPSREYMLGLKNAPRAQVRPDPQYVEAAQFFGGSLYKDSMRWPESWVEHPHILVTNVYYITGRSQHIKQNQSNLAFSLALEWRIDSGSALRKVDLRRST